MEKTRKWDNGAQRHLVNLPTAGKQEGYTVHFGPKDWTVYFKFNSLKVKRPSVVGLTNRQDRIIYVYVEDSFTDTWNNCLHELTHAYLYSYGISCSDILPNSDGHKAVYTEEDLCVFMEQRAEKIFRKCSVVMNSHRDDYVQQRAFMSQN